MTQQKEFPKITEEALNQLRQFIGKEETIKEPFNRYATPDTIRHFAHGMGDINPLFTDEEYAKKTKWGGVIAPPTFFFTCYPRGRVEGLPGVHGMWAGASFEMEGVLRAGTRIEGHFMLSGLTPKQSQFSGRSVVQEYKYFFTDSQGRPLCNVRDWMVRTERDSAQKRGAYKEVKATQYTPEDIERIYADYDKEEIRGATPRYWEDVLVGDELPHVVKGPLRVTDNIAWKIGWGFRPFVFAHKLAVELRKRHPAAFIPNDYGIPDIPERVHWDPVMARRVGVPEPYDYGPQRTAWLCQAVTNWAGDDGFIKKFWAEERRFNMVTNVHWLKGKVTSKQITDGKGTVELELWGDNQHSETTIRGGAIVVLPQKGPQS